MKLVLGSEKVISFFQPIGMKMGHTFKILLLIALNTVIYLLFYKTSPYSTFRRIPQKQGYLIREKVFGSSKFSFDAIPLSQNSLINPNSFSAKNF